MRHSKAGKLGDVVRVIIADPAPDGRSADRATDEEE